MFFVTKIQWWSAHIACVPNTFTDVSICVRTVPTVHKTQQKLTKSHLYYKSVNRYAYFKSHISENVENLITTSSCNGGQHHEEKASFIMKTPLLTRPERHGNTFLWVQQAVFNTLSSASSCHLNLAHEKTFIAFLDEQDSPLPHFALGLSSNLKLHSV